MRSKRQYVLIDANNKVINEEPYDSQQEASEQAAFYNRNAPRVNFSLDEDFIAVPVKVVRVAPDVTTFPKEAA